MCWLLQVYYSVAEVFVGGEVELKLESSTSIGVVDNLDVGQVLKNWHIMLLNVLMKTGRLVNGVDKSHAYLK